jgi:hypothetical protein
LRSTFWMILKKMF